MKDRDFKMRERWHRKEQERFERIEEKEAKAFAKEKEKWYKNLPEDIIDDSCFENDKIGDEARQRLLALLKE